MASERETTVSNEGSSGLLFLPVVVPLLGHGSVLPVCIAVRRATIFPFSRRERERGSFRVPVTLLVDTVPPSPLFPFPSLPPFSQKLYVRAIQFHSEAHIDTNPTIIFTSAPKSGLLKSFHYTFSSCTLEKSDSYLREIGGNSIDRFPSSSFSILIVLFLSRFPCFKPNPSHRYYLQIPNFLFFLTRIVRCTALKFIISWKIYSCRFAVEYIIDKYRYTVKDVGRRKFKSKFNLKYIYIFLV